MPTPSPLAGNPRVDAFNILAIARFLISEGGWCKRTNALDVYGEAVSPIDPAAFRFCLRGALDAAVDFLPGISHTAINAAGNKVYLVTGQVSLHVFNDDPNTMKSDVLDVLDEAMESLR